MPKGFEEALKKSKDGKRKRKSRKGRKFALIEGLRERANKEDRNGGTRFGENFRRPFLKRKKTKSKKKKDD